MALLRRQVKAYLLEKAGLAGFNSMTVVSNVMGAVTVTVNTNAMGHGIVSLQNWLVSVLALADSPLHGQQITWLVPDQKSDKTSTKFTTAILRSAESGVQKDSTYAMSSQRLLDLEAATLATALANAPASHTVAVGTVVPANAEVPSQAEAEARAAAIDQQQAEAEAQAASQPASQPVPEPVTLANMATTGRGRARRARN